MIISYIKENKKKLSAITGATLIGITGLIKVVSDELQEWYAISSKANPQTITQHTNIKRLNISRDALLDSLNKLDDEINIAIAAK